MSNIDENIAERKWPQLKENPKGFDPAVLNIIEALGSDVRTGKCLCPVHKDGEHGSLIFNKGDKQLVVFDCKGCGRNDEILDYLCNHGLWPTSNKLTIEYTSLKAEEARSPEERRKYAVGVWRKLKSSRGVELAELLKE